MSVGDGMLPRFGLGCSEALDVPAPAARMTWLWMKHYRLARLSACDGIGLEAFANPLQNHLLKSEVLAWTAPTQACGVKSEVVHAGREIAGRSEQVAVDTFLSSCLLPTRHTIMNGMMALQN